MAQFDPNPPQFNFRYDVPPMNIGQGYAQGIQQAGEGIAKGISGALDVATRSQAANDMLNTMHQSGILKDDQYNSLIGKSVTAKEQMLGMFANQWILDQANQRQMSLQRGQGGVETAVSHAKLLDLYNLTRSPTGDIRKSFWQPPQMPQQGTQTGTQPVPTPTQLGAAQQQAWQYGGPQPQPNVTPAPVAAQPNVGPALPAQATAQARPGGTPRLPGSRYVKDTTTGKTGWQYPSGAFIPD